MGGIGQVGKSVHTVHIYSTYASAENRFSDRGERGAEICLMCNLMHRIGMRLELYRVSSISLPMQFLHW